MGPISDAVGRALDSRDNSEQSTLQKIVIRKRLDRDLTDLLTHVDNHSWDAYQNKGSIGPIIEQVSSLTVSVYNNIENSDLDPTPEQLGWLHDRLDKLHELLQSRGGCIFRL